MAGHGTMYNIQTTPYYTTLNSTPISKAKGFGKITTQRHRGFGGKHINKMRLNHPCRSRNIKTRWMLIKRLFSSSIPKNEKRSDVRIQRRERGIW